jgi:hypothetical protein
VAGALRERKDDAPTLTVGIAPKNELRRALLRAADAIYSEDPIKALDGARQLRMLYIEHEALAVEWARESRVGWQRCARTLGVTKQSLWKRYRATQSRVNQPPTYADTERAWQM